MKRSFTKLAMMSLVVMAIASCTKTPDPVQPGDVKIELSASELKFTSPTDSTIEVSVESNTDWVALKDGDNGADWVTITPEEGKGGLEATKMSVRVSANESSAQRYAMIRVSSKVGNITKELTVTQFPALSALGKDSLILANFYESAEGWKWKQPWTIEDPVSMWPGITVAIAGGELRVTRVDLQDQRINGMIPDEFQYLDEMVFFQSYSNNHQGQKLPEWLPKLKKLKEFCVASCNMGGPIPESYWDMTQLIQMRLESNGFTGPLSEKVGQMVNLDNLSLDSNPITGKVPGTIGKMSKLRDINLNGCMLEGDLPAGIGDAVTIENIRFDDNPKLTGAIPEEWGNIKNLKTLNLASCEGITKLPASLSKCQIFWELDIKFCPKITEIPETWVECSELEYIRAYMSGLNKLPNWESHPSLIAFDAGWCQLEGAIPGFVGGLKNAYFSQNKGLTGELPESVYTSKTLQDIYLDSCLQVTGTVPTEFWLKQNFVNLNFAHTQLGGVLPTDEQYQAVSLGFQVLNLENCKFSGPIPAGIFMMPKIQNLNLMDNNFEGTLPGQAIANAVQLARLGLSGNRLTGEFPEVIKKHDSWSSKNLWNPRVRICPQQEGAGFAGTSCTDSAPEA